MTANGIWKLLIHHIATLALPLIQLSHDIIFILTLSPFYYISVILLYILGLKTMRFSADVYDFPTFSSFVETVLFFV